LPKLAIEASDDVTDSEFDKLLEQKAKTKSERYRERSTCSSFAGFPLMLPWYCDDDGWHAQIRLLLPDRGRRFETQSDCVSKLKSQGAVKATQTEAR